MNHEEFLDRVMVALGKLLGERKHRDENMQFVMTEVLSNHACYELIWRTGNTLDIVHKPADGRLSRTAVSRVYMDVGLWGKPRALATMIAGVIEGYDIYRQKKGDASF